ncbi:hypothetical protein LOTGIDRAFT_164647 [Lottia gigantea]|uniref:EF-hand domain-containing protein n=1 Tax=Lottia gigantea TaxID=225164 RepID=V4A4P3_LOTGI|nr:hypothetical protein LOTGIDRAFT_164647 [Lottia gigantea]ESO89950.1 hypothetical protein LOTGIDRAFT_164647 [Lottia gigantea]
MFFLLRNNRITVECAKHLAIGLKKNTLLKSLNLNQNAMKDEGVEAILKAIMINSSLKLLSVEEIGLNINNARLIQDISINKGIPILHGGTGGYQRNTAITSILNMFRVYLESNYNDIQSAFQMQDKEQLGILNSDEIRNCLKDHGLRMTNRMLDSLLEELDKTNTGNIFYRDLLNIAFISDHVKHRSVDHTSIHNGEMGR